MQSRFFQGAGRPNAPAHPGTFYPLTYLTASGGSMIRGVVRRGGSGWSGPASSRRRVAGPRPNPYASRRPLWLIAGLSLLAILLACATPALASRAHEYTTTFGEPCTVEPCEGEHLKQPEGVAVSEATGDVYVVDKGANRAVRFNSEGVFQSEFTGPNATGSGTLTAGSKTVESVLVSSGAFTVGEELTAPGVPAGTTVTAVGAGTLKLSNPVEEEKSGVNVELTAQQRLLKPTEVAVDNSCVLRKLKEPELTAEKCGEEDPSNGDVYVVDAGGEETGEIRGVVDKFTAAGAYLGQITEAGGSELNEERLDGVAVDPAGTVWIYRERPGLVKFSNEQPNRFLSPEIRPAHLGGFASAGLAVDSKEDFYGRLAVEQHVRVVKWDHSGNILIEKLGCAEATGVAVEQISDTSVVDCGTSVGVFNPEGGELERLGEETGEKHLTAGAGVGVNASTSFVYVADAGAGRVVVFGPAKPAAPRVEGESFSDVGSDHATIAATVNPRSEPTDQPTTYRFRYGRCATATTCATSGYEAELPEPPGQLPPDFETHPVSVKLTGLQPATTYHFQLLAGNEHGEGTPGEDVTFTTEGEGGELTLPDHRGWELVSPPDKHGALIEMISESGVVQAAASGPPGITYLADAPTEAQPEGNSNLAQVLSRRTPASWSSRDIVIPHAAATGAPVGPGPEYRYFDRGLDLSVVQPFGQFNPDLSEEASEQTAFLHDLSIPCGTHCFRPLVTGRVPFANVPEGTQFGEDERCEPRVGFEAGTVCGPKFLGASEDLSHMALSATAPLTPGAAVGALYEWSGGSLKPVSVPPGQEAAEEGKLGLESQAVRGAISSDGARISWEGKGALYERDTVLEKSVQLDAAKAPAGEGAQEVKEREKGSGGGRFQVQSADGQRVIFKDDHPLTADSGAVAGKADLYECQITIEEGELACALSDLTPKHGGESAEVQGGILGASADASTIYFVAKGVLSEEAGADGRGKAAPGQFNLYMRSGGVTRFITALSVEDGHDWIELLEGQPTRVSPDGRFLELMSQAPLTGYDNRDRESNQPTAEVFTYDRDANRLSCASCDPSGVRPVGVEYQKLEPGSGGLVGGGRGIWEVKSLVAANVPGWTQIRSAGPIESRHQPDYLDNQGRLFFDTVNPLVAQDSNATQDVYEYEPPGVGDCTESSATYSARSGGCVSLISSGSSAQESAFMDASESGDDVFFLTSARLSKLDVDNQRDIYDAHVCSTTEPCITFPDVQSPPCTNESSCKPSPTPQPSIFVAPASATFNGPGNLTPAPPAPPKHRTAAQIRAEQLKKALKACRRKHNRHKRQGCERQAHRRYGARTARTTSHRRRTR